MSRSWKRMVCALSLGLSMVTTQFASAATSEVLIQAGTKGLSVETLVIMPDGARNERLPVLLMKHGFLMSQTYYRDVVSQIADQGFVVIAPQAYRPGGLPFGKPSTEVEAQTMGLAMKWAEANLSEEIDQALDFSRIGLLGHSRGAKVAWLMMRDGLVKAQAVASIDPVDGTQDGSGRVTSGDYLMPVPTLLIGTGLGGDRGGLFSPACAPVGDNYDAFFGVTSAPTWLMVAQDFGHVDFLDANANCGMHCSVCASAGRDHSKEDFREFLGTTIGQFMRGVLYQQPGLLDSLSDQSLAPIRVSVKTK